MLKEFKWWLKKKFKKSQFWQDYLSKLLFIYLKIVYKTSRWQFTYQDSCSEHDFLKSKNTIYALWHNRLAFGNGIFKNHQNIYALVSSHSDGMIIGKIINNFGVNILEGSSNKNSVGVLKQIIAKLKIGANIVITPDGPRGPAYQINSNITEIARKYHANLIPISCTSSNFFLLKSWDKLIMPLPFGTIQVVVGSPIIQSNNQQINDKNLTKQLNILGDIAENKIINR